MERTTKQITTPGAHKVILKSYVTAREKKAVDALILKDVHYEMGNANTTDKVPAPLLIEYGEKQIEAVVVSIDDKEKDVLNLVLDLPLPDFNYIQEEVRKVYNGNLTKEK